MATYAELKAQAEELMAQAEKLRQEEIAQVVAGIHQTMTNYGLTAADLGFAPKAKAGRSSNSTRTRTAARYQGPQGQLWSGHGRKPNWLVTEMAQGKSLDDFRVGTAV
ncbi:DNA binding protein, nucleoid-associated [compost metagenome]